MVYNINYFENLLRTYSATAQEINEIRWNWVNGCKAKTVLDYGCGCGWFRAYRNGAHVDTYDVMDVPQTGITKDKYDLVCFWDVLEHIEDLTQVKSLIEKSGYTAITVPIKPENVEMEKWKHYKPGEHVRYYTFEDMINWMGSCGKSLVKSGTPECPPRTDIYSFLFKMS